jgi:hypothetical protein
MICLATLKYELQCLSFPLVSLLTPSQFTAPMPHQSTFLLASNHECPCCCLSFACILAAFLSVYIPNYILEFTNIFSLSSVIHHPSPFSPKFWKMPSTDIILYRCDTYISLPQPTNGRPSYPCLLTHILAAISFYLFSDSIKMHYMRHR